MKADAKWEQKEHQDELTAKPQDPPKPKPKYLVPLKASEGW